MKKKLYNFIGLFVIVLILSTPFYSANALAVSIEVTRNSGEKGVNQFLNGEGDTWTVEAQIIDSPEATINAESVKVRFSSSNEDQFDTCNPGQPATTCSYTSPLPNGLAEGTYPFEVVYSYRDSIGQLREVKQPAVINSDAQAPKVTVNTGDVFQNEQGKIQVSFSITDKQNTVPSAGIDFIEIKNAETNEVLKLIPRSEITTDPFSFSDVLDVQFPGDQRRFITVEGVDLLGHRTTNAPVIDFSTDFIAPVIRTGSLNFTGIGKFIGQRRVETPMKLDIIENKELNPAKVIASSQEAELDNTPATRCDPSQEVEDLWHCVWEAVEVSPHESISVEFTITDEKGNKLTQSLQQRLTVDQQAPQIEYFGMLQQFEGRNYVREEGAGHNTLVLQFSEQGAGIDTEQDLKINLESIGGTAAASPTECDLAQSICYWDVPVSGLPGDAFLVNLNRFQDRVGNEGELREIELQLDATEPKVRKIELFGVSDQIAEKDYLQSGDRLKIKMDIEERRGITVLVDVNSLVTDAQIPFDESYFTRGIPPVAGWQVFTEEDCQRDEDNELLWHCEFETVPIKSGFLSSVPIEIVVQDTAGNKAEGESWEDDPANVKDISEEHGKYRVEILGLSGEDAPDQWSVEERQIRFMPDFIDLDTTHLLAPRLAATVPLRAEEVFALRIDNANCIPDQDATLPGNVTAAGLEVSRTLIYGGVSTASGRSAPTVVVELVPFEGSELFGGAIDEVTRERRQGQEISVEVPFKCQFQVYSQIGSEALAQAELQEFTLKVPFGFSQLGAQDQNLEEKIKDIKDDAFFKVADKLKFLNTVLDFANYLANFANIILSISEIVNIFTAGTQELRAAPVIGQPLASAICSGNQISQTKNAEIIETFVQVPVQILSCNPNAFSENSWYGGYQRTILEYYNTATFRTQLGFPASSLRENMYLSTVGLCVPGMIENLEKYRQIRCREAVCLQKEVPAGIATVSSCSALGDRLICEYFAGPAFNFISPLAIWDEIITIIKSYMESPIGLIKTGLVGACAISCPFESIGPYVCNTANFLIRLGDIVNSLVTVIQVTPGKAIDPYCSQL